MNITITILRSNKDFISVAVLLLVLVFCSKDTELPLLLNVKPETSADSSVDTTLLYADDLIYKGAFKVPSKGFGTTDKQSVGFSYGGTAPAYNPVNNSLFLTGHDWYQLVGEISIPAVVNSHDPQKLNRAELLQPLSDITEERMNQVGENGAELGGCKLGGLLVVNDKILGTSYVYYDASGSAKLSHFISTTDLTLRSDVNGFYSIGTKGAGFVAGYMCTIPLSWQSLFGGDALTGQGCLAIISRTSYGPSVTSFYLNDIGRKIPAVGTMLVGYPSSHPTLGQWGNSTTVNPNFNMATSVNGVVFPENCGSVLFFGSTGLGIPQYGIGTKDSALHGTDVPDTDGKVKYAYDPANGSKGCHAFPYCYYVWAYRAVDLAEVYSGKRQKQPWEIIPYATWELELPFTTENGSRGIGGTAYDKENNLIYISQLRTDNNRPIVHVFTVRK